ncbi:MAG: hypothetical protein GY927_11020 [bacterium]|nr:hypothetical protein [bacterium]
MSEKTIKKLFRKDNFVAEIEVSLIVTDHEWAPYYSIEDVRKMETVEKALEEGDLKTVAKLAHLYTLTPVAAE